jgi:dUTP pyrophosphatase
VSGAAGRNRGRNSVLHVPVVRLSGARDLPLPSYATPGASGLDLRACVEREVCLAPGARALVPTGIALALPTGYEGQVRGRSGLALHHGIVLPNAPGTIDSDYRGEVKVVLLNAGSDAFRINRGDRIAQLVIAPVAHAEWHEMKELPETSRATGGFGHTGRSARADTSRERQ